MLGVLLAGGAGSRLWPCTEGTSKHLLPIFNKPMIYYSLTTLLLSRVERITVVVNPWHRRSFESLLGNGEAFGVQIGFHEQTEALGIVHPLQSLDPKTLKKGASVVLGDNFFYGSGVGESLPQGIAKGAVAFGIKVSNPSEYGVALLDEAGLPRAFIEKPDDKVSDIAVTGLYYFDESLSERANAIPMSHRGEFEVTDLLNSYLETSSLSLRILPRGTAWMDTGRPESLLQASQFVQAVEDNQGLLVGSPHEAAFRMGRISRKQLLKLLDQMPSGDYRNKLATLA